MTLIDDYFEYQIQYERKYGKRTIVLMEVGSFFEFYGVDNQTEKIGQVQKIAELLNIQMTRRNKAILENDRSNCLMAGFPSPSIKRFLNILITNQYTVVLIEQVTPPPNPQREITQIISPSTYIEEINTPESRNIVSIYVEQTVHHRSAKNTILIGATSIDPSSGKCIITEICTEHAHDQQLLMEELYRFVEITQPKEIIIHNFYSLAGGASATHSQNKVWKQSDFESGLNLERRILFYHEFTTQDTVDNESYQKYQQYQKVSYQQQFYATVYGKETFGLITPIEALNLERFPHISLSFIYLLNYLREHNERMINKLLLPIFWTDDRVLRLHHNTIYQLNLLAYNQSGADYYQGVRCLFDVINYTSTSIGNRLLKERMLKPSTDPAELERRYSLTEIVMRNREYQKYKQQLATFIDIERAFRKWVILMIQPHEMAAIYYTIDALRAIVQTAEFPRVEFKLESAEIENMGEFLGEFVQWFELEEMSKVNFLNMRNFLKEGVSAEVDQVQREITEIEQFFQSQKQYFHQLLIENDSSTAAATKKKNAAAAATAEEEQTTTDVVKLDFTERDGYFFTTSNRRADVLRPHLPTKKYEMKKHTTTNTKIVGIEINAQSHRYVDKLAELASKVKKAYFNILSDMGKKYSTLFLKLITFVGEFDVAVSSAHIADNYHYTRPRITLDNHQSYFRAAALRHPIVERIQKDTFYVTNDISLHSNGILLFGMNGAGKSTIMKAIGLCVIMAQMGLHVPCDQFEFWPYQTLFTRISGEDNIFKGQSSFAVEMLELRSILRYADQKSLVIGDEICRGTEDISGLSIVVSAIERFCGKGVSFILATHLHKLGSMEHLRDFSNLTYKHLRVEFNDINQSFTYGRKLQDGPGSSLYGIEVARYILQDSEFTHRAFELRRQFEKKQIAIIETHTSKYNADLIIDHCEICNKTVAELGKGQLDVHHILFQQCFRNGLESNIGMNDLQNLVVLCKEHHQDVHQSKIEICGYKKTSNGKMLDWSILQLSKPTENQNVDVTVNPDENSEEPIMEENKKVVEINEEMVKKEKVSRKKFQMEQIMEIMKFKDAPNKKLILQILQQKYNIRTSLGTLHKIWSGIY